MELTITYIFSQILVVLYYLIYSGTFHIKEKNKILLVGSFATLLSAVSYFLLQAYTGIAMCLVAIIRNIWFSKSKSKKSLIIIYLITLLLSVFSYQNVFSILNIFATIIYTYSLWQESTKNYKKFGIIVNGLMIVYDTYIQSIMGVFFMIISFISSIIGYYKENNKNEETIIN